MPITGTNAANIYSARVLVFCGCVSLDLKVSMNGVVRFPEAWHASPEYRYPSAVCRFAPNRSRRASLFYRIAS